MLHLLSYREQRATPSSTASHLTLTLLQANQPMQRQQPLSSRTRCALNYFPPSCRKLYWHFHPVNTEQNNIFFERRHQITTAVGFACYCCSAGYFFFSLLTLLLSSFWTSRGHRCRPFSPPGFCLQFLSRIGFSNPTARRFFIEGC